MSEYLSEYLTLGTGFYLGMVLKAGYKSFKEASYLDIFLGWTFCFLLWPLAAIGQFVFMMMEAHEYDKEEKNDQ